MKGQDGQEMDEAPDGLPPVVDRYALVVVAAHAFLEWLHTVPDSGEVTARDECTGKYL